MAMPPCGTFVYTGSVPEGAWNAGGWQLRDVSGADPLRSDEPLRDNRLVGLRPTLQISGGCLILTASGENRAQVASACFELDPGSIDVFESGDAVNLARTATGDIGVSLLREGKLIFAVGAATAVATGSAVSVQCGQYPEPEPWTIPSDTWIDVSVTTGTERLRPGTETIVGDFKVSVLRCFEVGFPGSYECLAISLEGACSHDATLRSAQRLERTNAGLKMSEWPIDTPHADGPRSSH